MYVSLYTNVNAVLLLWLCTVTWNNAFQHLQHYLSLQQNPDYLSVLVSEFPHKTQDWSLLLLQRMALGFFMTIAIKSIDHCWYYSHFHNIKSINSWVWKALSSNSAFLISFLVSPEGQVWSIYLIAYLRMAVHFQSQILF